MSIDVDKVEVIVKQLQAHDENMKEEDIAAITLALVAFGSGFDYGDKGYELEPSLKEFLANLQELSEKIKTRFVHD